MRTRWILIDVQCRPTKYIARTGQIPDSWFLMCASDAPFYGALDWAAQKNIAFKASAKGQNHLYGMLRHMVVPAGIGEDRKLTNHSARKYLIQNVAPNYIQQGSGHKNIQSINNYSHLNTPQQEAISDVLAVHHSTDLALPGPSNARTMPSSAVDLGLEKRALKPLRLSPVQHVVSFHGTHQSTQSSSSGQFVGCTFAGPVTINYHAEKPSECARVLLHFSDSDDSQWTSLNEKQTVVWRHNFLCLCCGDGRVLEIYNVHMGILVVFVNNWQDFVGNIVLVCFFSEILYFWVAVVDNMKRDYFLVRVMFNTGVIMNGRHPVQSFLCK